MTDRLSEPRGRGGLRDSFRSDEAGKEILRWNEGRKEGKEEGMLSSSPCLALPMRRPTGRTKQYSLPLLSLPRITNASHDFSFLRGEREVEPRAAGRVKVRLARKSARFYQRTGKDRSSRLELRIQTTGRARSHPVHRGASEERRVKALNWSSRSAAAAAME